MANGYSETYVDVSERSRIIGLQLRCVRLQREVQAALEAHLADSPASLLASRISSGFLSKEWQSDRQQLDLIQCLRDQVAASMTSPATATGGSGRMGGSGAPGGSSMVQVLGRARPRVHAVAALEHLTAWLEQQSMSVSGLAELAGPEPEASTNRRGFLEMWDLVRSEGQEEPLMDRRLMSFRWSCPVAHLVGDFPRELLRAVTCPPTQDVAAAGGLAGPLQMAPRPHGHGSGGIGDDGDVFSREGEPPADMEVTAQDPPVRWDFAPYIFEPRSQQLYRLARHPSLGQAVQLAGDGDVILLRPGRYDVTDDVYHFRRSVRVIGVGLTQKEVVLHNGADDDNFLECTGTEITFENLTMLQLGGYDGIVQVSAGRTTLIDCTLQCGNNGSAALLRNHGSTLIMHGCKVIGACGSGIQVEAGGTRLELYSSEIAQCGGGDDLMPRDLGAIDVQVRLRPLSSLGPPVLPPVISTDDQRWLCKSGSRKSNKCNNNDNVNDEAASTANGLAASAYMNDNGAAQHSAAQHGSLPTHPAAAPSSLSPAAISSPSGAFSAPPLPPNASPEPSLESVLSASLCRLDDPATVVIGPGCKIHSNKGFALSIVKPRSVALLHEAMGGATGGEGLGGSINGGPGAASGALAAALEGVQVFVHSGAQHLASGNTRGAVGVVDTEYADMDGDEVNSRTSAKHFHSVQLSAQQLRDGFFSRGCDWTQVRKKCARLAAASASLGGGSGSMGRGRGRGVTSAARRLRGGGGAGGGAGPGMRGAAEPSPPGGGAGALAQVTREAASPLRMLLCRSWLRAVLQGEGAEIGGPRTAPMGCSIYYEEDDDEYESSEEEEADGKLSGEGAAAAAAVAAVGSRKPGRSDASGGLSSPGDPGGGGSAPSPRPGAGLRPASSVSGGSGSETGSATHRHHLRRCWACGAVAMDPASEADIAAAVTDGGTRIVTAVATELSGLGALKKCSGCRRALYCSGPCQVGHWKAHKDECKIWAAERAERAAATGSKE